MNSRRFAFSCALALTALLPALSFADESAAAQAPTTRVLSLEDTRAKYRLPTSHFVTLEGINVHYSDEGKGPAILLIHGTMGDLRDWDVWAETLKSDFRVVRLDMPAFGLTGPVANKNYSAERVHTLIDGLMDYLKIEKFGIVGISYGGPIVFRYAATRTDRVTSMILINSAGIQTGKSAPASDSSGGSWNRNFLTCPVVTEKDIRGFYSSYINDASKITPELVQRKLDYQNIKGRDGQAVDLYAMYEKGDPIRVLSHVKAPSLIMWGSANNALDTSTAQAFVSALTSASSVSLKVFQEGGHYINLERPLETAAAARTWLLANNK
jgi:pimeloyl-ACP methyl ester carboxylesterase